MGGKLPPYAVAESDNNPVVYQPWKIIFPNGTVTDVGDGTVYIGIGTSISTTTSITVSSYDVRTPVLVAGTILSFLTNGTISTFLNGAGNYTSVYDARSPLLSSGTILSIKTDGTTTNFLRGDGVYSVPSGVAGLTYAPSGATYIIQTNNSTLSNAQILASLSTGLLKNTAVTGVLIIASGGVDFENLVTAGSPLLRIGNVFNIDTASTTKNGYLQFADFNTFNAKASTATTISTVAPLAGGGDLSANRVISITTDGTTTNYLRGDGTYRSVYETKSPLLSVGTIVSLLTDGTATNYLRGDGTYHSVYEVRSPLVSAGTVISIITDGSTTNFMRGDGTLAVPSSNSGVKIILFTVYSSTSWTAENIPIGQAPFETPITIRQVNATVSGGASPELGFNIDHRLWGGLATAGTNIFATTQSANSTGFEAVSFNSANIPAKAHLVLVSSAVITGNVDYITGAIYYTRNSI